MTREERGQLGVRQVDNSVYFREVAEAEFSEDPYAGSTRKREFVSRRAPKRRVTQIFFITTPAPFPRRSHCSSKNVRDSPIKAQKKALCTRNAESAL